MHCLEHKSYEKTCMTCRRVYAIYKNQGFRQANDYRIEQEKCRMIESHHEEEARLKSRKKAQDELGSIHGKGRGYCYLVLLTFGNDHVVKIGRSKQEAFGRVKCYRKIADKAECLMTASVDSIEIFEKMLKDKFGVLQRYKGHEYFLCPPRDEFDLRRVTQHWFSQTLISYHQVELKARQEKEHRVSCKAQYDKVMDELLDTVVMVWET